GGTDKGGLGILPERFRGAADRRKRSGGTPKPRKHYVAVLTRSLSFRLSTFPVGVLGRSVSTNTSLGIFHCGRFFVRQNSRMSSGLIVWPSRAMTNATTTSPRDESRLPTTATSATAGC